MISVRDSSSGRTNVCTAAWVTGVNWAPPKVMVALSKAGLSWEFLRSSGEFVVNVPGMELIEGVVFCGRTTGREVDKLGCVPLTMVPGKKVSTPHVRESLAYLECVSEHELEMDDHRVFTGKVVHAAVHEGIFEDGYDVSKIRPVYQIIKERFTTIDGVERRYKRLRGVKV